MPLIYTSDDLVDSIRNRGIVGDTDSLGTTDRDILRYATEVLWTKICPELMRAREEYFVQAQRISTSSATSRYRLPSRALSLKLRNVFAVNASGQRRVLFRIPPEDLAQFSTSGGPAVGYYLEGTDLVLVPEGSGGTESIEFSFYFRPGSLVPTSEARRVSSVASATVLEVADAFPSTFTTSSLFDVHAMDSGAEIRSWDLPATTITASPAYRITFSTPVDGSVFGTRPVRAGDWICLAEEAAVPGCPKEWHPLIVEGVAFTLGATLGDFDLAKFQAQEFAADRQGLLRVSESRVESRPMKIRGRGGLIRGW